ncbi:hypothetical protein GGR58DRAFT_508228 [Xylaria digitata]|nr:hypothetical protein GGR58DRAFT_508228 [Xylaria digitata]
MSPKAGLTQGIIAWDGAAEHGTGGSKAKESPQLCRNLYPRIVHYSHSQYAQLSELPSSQSAAQPPPTDQRTVTELSLQGESVAQSQLYSLPQAVNSVTQSLPIYESWPESWKDESLTELFGQALTENQFSAIPVDDLPFSLPEIPPTFEHHVERAAREILFLDSLTLGIKTGNQDLLNKLVLDEEMSDVNLSPISPFHLAASYLVSSRACCEVLTTLVRLPNTRHQLSSLYINDLKHTVLNSLMVMVLKSHSAPPPELVEDKWKECGFPGTEVDICGTWEPDTPEVVALIDEGAQLVPLNWKHKFCHSSVQAICHFIHTLFAFTWSLDINTPSGLFLRCCGHCRSELRLGPLHALVVTAAYLVRYGCGDEDLFGIVACGLSLITSGADPTIRANVSAPDLYYGAPRDTCVHEDDK